ncbi:disease resistance RPP13-like protein 4 [Tanacetum coccineum]
MEVEGFEPPHEEEAPIRRSERPHRAPNRLCLNVEFEEHSLGDLDEPANYKAAMLDPESNKWLDAMNAKMQSMKDNQVSCLVHLPPDSRLVAKGFTQTYGVDYEETFSPVADIRAIRILIAIAAFYDYKIWQTDVKTAFLNGYLDEDIYMVQPEGFIDPKYPRKASGSNVTFLILYVDDIIIMGNHIPSLQSVKTYLGKCQIAYMDKILKRYRMYNSKRDHIPMQERLDLNKTQGASTPEEVKRMQNVPYALVVGSIMYANHDEPHWTAVKTILKYLRNTKDMFLVYGAVDWKISKQNTTAMSAIEAEYIATSEAAIDVVWIRKFISGLAGYLSTPELYTTNESADAVTTQILGSAFSSPPEVQPTTTRELGNSSSPEIQLVTKTFITQIPESSFTRDIGISSPIEVQPATAQECFTDPEPNKYAMEIQPILETSIAQIPDSDVNMPDTMTSAHDLGSSSSSEIQPMNTPKTSTHDLSNQDDSTSVIQTNSPAAAKSDTNTLPMTNKLDIFSEIYESTDPQATNNDITSTNVDSPVPDPDQERKQLVNLIEQELDFVSNIYPKLGKHQDHIKKESDEVSQSFKNLKDEPCELKELKDMKKTVTKLKLQIPAKYRTYDENKEDKDGVDARNVISSKLLKQMPQLHNKLFHETPFCRTIQQRYDSLRSELKLCLLCFSVFPENAIISRRLMVYLWIGEGLIPQANYEDGEKTVEEYGNELFKELLDMDFIEPISKSYGCNVAICKMHPMVRASLVMIADTVRFFDFDEYGNPKDFGKFDEIESPEDLPVIYPLGDPREFFDFFDENQLKTSKKIEFTDSKGNSIQFAAFPKDPNLQDPNLPLVDCYEKPIDTKRNTTFTKRRRSPQSRLRWQSSAAHHIEVDDFKFEESLEHMNHVRFFSLQGVSKISELPKSISNLQSLQILDLRACHNLDTIPRTISLLKYLTHLDMSDCYLLEHMPKEISSLKSLQVLKGVVVVESPRRHACTLHDLKKLENLRKLSVYTHVKDFTQESHLDALQKFETLRKLSIWWGSHEKSKTDKADSKRKKAGQDATKKHSTDKDAKNKDSANKTKDKPASRVIKQILKKPWVKGSMRRMNAFNNATLGSRLEKLDLKCYPVSVTPNWLTPGSLKGLKKLYIRGGNFSDLSQYQDILEWDDSPIIPPIETWNVEVLRLKYLDEIKMDWRELQTLFPNMTSLEKVKCPRLTLFPCNEQGFWNNKTTKMTT